MNKIAEIIILFKFRLSKQLQNPNLSFEKLVTLWEDKSFLHRQIIVSLSKDKLFVKRQISCLRTNYLDPSNAQFYPFLISCSVKKIFCDIFVTPIRYTCESFHVSFSSEQSKHQISEFIQRFANYNSMLICSLKKSWNDSMPLKYHNLIITGQHNRSVLLSTFWQRGNFRQQ